MKKSQREPVVKIDEFEDLTLFANESFDTQDVDLFEFSSEESSPLTRLKSIILSLDWEINDDILQELADELETLQAMWTDDKVAEVYLQGLSKLGGYLRTRGAYAHPNSIKLLLTFFYNFEKIISSQNISGEEISNLLKGDVRKFRILQYQINQSDLESSPPVVEPTEAAAPLHPQESALRGADHGKELKAAILSLDWEVTDDSLRHFNTKLSRFHEEVTDNKGALVLIQGLQALGDYIAEERADAHPEAFILLHSFNDALEQVARVDHRYPWPRGKEGYRKHSR
jgi:pilus assembly protein FimV